MSVSFICDAMDDILNEIHFELVVSHLNASCHMCMRHVTSHLWGGFG